MPRFDYPRLQPIAVGLFLLPYLAYLGFVLLSDRGPIDYETFMATGQRLRSGADVYGPNSYYPLPFIQIFAIFSWLPRPLSMTLWLLGPVLLALALSGWRPSILLFAPVFAHFVGGQTAVFGLLGLWGYRRSISPDNSTGGVFLALTLLKPQLGLVPLAFALAHWWSNWRITRHIPRQAWAWLLTMTVLYGPSLVVAPDWPRRWLQTPRPVFERAVSGLIPRTLLMAGLPPHESIYWLLWTALSALVVLIIWLIGRRQVTLAGAVLASFVISPLVHDYDLLQVVPLLSTRLLRWAAVGLSLPGWWVILSAYGNDSAWAVFTLIAPGLFGVHLYQHSKMKHAIGVPEPVPG